MKRRLALALTVLFGLLTLAAAAGWALSHRSGYGAGRYLTGDEPAINAIHVHDGVVSCFTIVSDDPPAGTGNWNWWFFSNDSSYYREVEAENGFWGFGYGEGSGPFQTSYRCWAAPMWSITLLCALACVFLGRAYRRTFFPPGTCRNCGYDLRASPERCPECGSGVSA